MAAVQAWTGTKQYGCPWRALFDPFVQEVLHYYPAYERGALDVMCPDPPHKLVEGLLQYDSDLRRCQGMAAELEREKHESARGAR